MDLRMVDFTQWCIFFVFQSPMDKCRLVFPVVPATLLASFVYMFYLLIAPVPVTHSFISGTIIGYLFYDLTHYYLHHGSPSLTYFKDLKTYHVKHHFKTQNKGKLGQIVRKSCVKILLIMSCTLSFPRSKSCNPELTTLFCSK